MYRLLRTSDYNRLLESVADANGQNTVLRERLIEATATARSKSTLADGLIARVNQLEMECGELKAQITGRPQNVPQIGRQSIRDQVAQTGDDLEDAGDERAALLKAAGLLHDSHDPDELAMPAGAALVP